MILVLQGAKKNVGDFLIRERGIALLREGLGDCDLEVHDRWMPLDDAVLRRAKAVVLCGGPGLVRDFYPGIFPLVADLNSLELPVIPIALGWKAPLGVDPQGFRFSPESEQALSLIAERVSWISVRDNLSLEVLKANGIHKARCTGCVSWYYLPTMGKGPDLPENVLRLVFTPPANPRLVPETIRVMHVLRDRFPKTERICVFHRGIRRDKHTRSFDSIAARTEAFAASRLGFRVVDASYDLSSIAFYRETDMHVGYRVHAHLCFLSYGKPSLLISEDSRGLGQSLTLKDPYLLRAGNRNLVASLLAALDSEIGGGYVGSIQAIDKMQRTWPEMRSTIAQVREVIG